MTGLENKHWADLKVGTLWQTCGSGTMELTSTNTALEESVFLPLQLKKPRKLKRPSLSLPPRPFPLISCLAGSREEDQG